VNLPATYVEVFKNGISVELILALGRAVDVTYHSLIPKDDGNLKINLFLRFGSYGTGISLINLPLFLYYNFVFISFL
jgi:hypothetical protein